jgi:hypothetical protein
MSKTFQVSNSFSRPANTTGYADEDLIANNTSSGSVTAMYFGTPPNAKISMAKLMKSSVTSTAAAFTLYLYDSQPTVTNGDNGAYTSIEANFIGSIAINCTSSTFSDDAGGVATLTVPIYPNGACYGLLKAEASYTPASGETFTITLFGEHD